MSSKYQVNIIHETFGKILSLDLVDKVQFKLFLKALQGSLALKQDFTTYNGDDFLVHIPYKHLVNSIITTDVLSYTLTEHLKNKIEEKK
jgi:hypothetical protein